MLILAFGLALGRLEVLSILTDMVVVAVAADMRWECRQADP